MNPNIIELLNMALGVASYAFVILFVFNILKVDYFNPIVKRFIAFYKPISKISIFSNQLYMIFIIASFLLKDLLLSINPYQKFLFLVTSFI